MTQVSSLYPCSQKDLYSVLETAWANYSSNLSKFTTFKPLYVAATKTTALTAISSAKALPDDYARSGASEVLHIGLVNIGKTCAQNFQILKSYIETVFPDPLVQNVQFLVAGQSYYRDAAHGDWESMELLNQNVKNYLTTNNTILLGVAPNLNMPSTFAASVAAASANFSAQYANFKTAEQTSLETATKIKANNAIYKTCISMMKDGQIIFMNEPENLIKFQFSRLLALINPPTAGVKGSVKESLTFLPISAVQLTAQLDGEIAKNIEIDLNGEFGIELKEGNYTLNINAVGYVSQTIKVTLKLTGLKTINFELEKI